MAYNIATTTSTSLEMASFSKFSYHRLQNEEVVNQAAEERTFRRIRKWSSFRRYRFRKRPKIRIGALRRSLRKRERFFSRLKVYLRKALKRLKNGQAHMNDLFGGNYLFMQPNPTPFMCAQKQVFMGHSLHRFPAASR